MVPYLATPEIRRALEVQFRRKFSLAELERIENAARPFVGRLHTGEMSPAGFAAQLQMLQLDSAAAPPKSKNRRPADRTLGLRALALASLIAREAAADPFVIAFRAKYLSDGFVPLESVGDWVRRRAAAEGPPSHLVTVAVQRDQLKGLRLSLTGEQEFRQSRVLQLDYPRHDPKLGLIVAHQPVAAGGALDQLRALADGLARRYRWDRPAYAVAFVLAGAVPPVVRLRVSTEENKAHISLKNLIRSTESEKDRLIGFALSRIRIEVEPTATAREVAMAYRQAQSEIRAASEQLSARRKGKARRRNRSVEARLLRLALFVGERGDADRAAMEAWNRLYPRMKYSTPQDFRTKARRAIFNVFGHPFETGAILKSQRETLASTLAVRNEKGRKNASKRSKSK